MTSAYSPNSKRLGAMYTKDGFLSRVGAVILALAVCLSVSHDADAVEVGDSIPALSFPHLAGEASGDLVALTSFKGKLVYIDVWASWCSPCRQSMPILNDWYQEFSDRGFEIVAVNVDEALPDALKFLRKTPVDYPILLDPGAKLPRAFSMVAMPTSYLVGPDGVVLYKHTGFKKSDIDDIRTTIEAFLPE